MENLTLRMNSVIHLMILLVLFIIVVAALQLHALRRMRTQRRKHQKRRIAMKERELRQSLPLLGTVALLVITGCSIKLNDYRLDREAGPVHTEGVVQHVGYTSAGRGGKRYRIIVEEVTPTGSGESLTLYIHRSLIDDYAIEEGTAYTLTYYPRTQTLGDIRKAE